MNHSEHSFLMWAAFSNEEGAPMQANTFKVIENLLEKGYIRRVENNVERYILTEKGNNEVKKMLGR